MRNAIRSILGIAALAAMLGGMLGQAQTPVQTSTVTPDMESAPLIYQPSFPETADAVRITDPSRVQRAVPKNPDAKRPFGQLIEISIARQELTAWFDGAVVYRFKVSTAKPGYRTPRGRFEVLNRASRWWSRQWQVWMPDALRFRGSYFIHALPYRSNPRYRNGAKMLGRPDSHGCVRVGVADSALLYKWARVGTPVWVH